MKILQLKMHQSSESTSTLNPEAIHSQQSLIISDCNKNWRLFNRKSSFFRGTCPLSLHFQEKFREALITSGCAFATANVCAGVSSSITSSMKRSLARSATFFWSAIE